MGENAEAVVFALDAGATNTRAVVADTGGSVIRHVSLPLNTGALNVTDNKKEHVL